MEMPLPTICRSMSSCSPVACDPKLSCLLMRQAKYEADLLEEVRRFETFSSLSNYIWFAKVLGDTAEGSTDSGVPGLICCMCLVFQGYQFQNCFGRSDLDRRTRHDRLVRPRNRTPKWTGNKTLQFYRRHWFAY